MKKKFTVHSTFKSVVNDETTKLNTERKSLNESKRRTTNLSGVVINKIINIVNKELQIILKMIN